MRFWKIYTLLTLFLFLSIAVFSQQLNYVQGEVLVKLKNEVNARQFPKHFEEVNGKFIDMKLRKKVSAPMNIYAYTFNWQQANENEVLKSIRQHPMVEIAQFNHFIKFRNTPNDPQFTDQWQYNNTGQSGGTVGADIDAELAWDITTGGVTSQGDTIVVCIIDDGCQIKHPVVEGNIWYNYEEIPNNGIDDDNNGFVDDFRGWNTGTNNDNVTQGGGHGTPVTGIIGAKGNNGVGVAGVNWNVKLMSVLGGSGQESEVLTAYSYPLVARKTYNETNGARGAFVVSTNASWGTDFGQPEDAPLWCAFYDTLGVHGILNAGATINGDYDVDVIGDLPTACPSEYLIAVTNMNDNDQKVQGAGYGAISIDLGAFGADTWTLTSGSGYGGFGGTSGATPHVTGTIALLYSAPCSDFINLAKADPGAAALKARQYILEGGDDNTSLDGITATGKRLNMHGSMLMLMEDCGPCPDPGALATQNVTDIQADLTWVSTGNATSDTLRWRESGTAGWTVIAGASSPVTITGLTACSNYEFQVKSQCDTLSSDYSLIYIFETDGCCENPENLAVTNIGDATATATWEAVLAAESYNIQIRPVGSMNWITNNTLSTSFDFTGLMPCGFYEIQIQVICASETVAYSSSTTFATSGCGPCIDLDYCAAPGLNSGEEWVETFTLNTIDNASGNNDSYGDFTGMMETELATYNSYDLSITPGYYNIAYEENIKIWIDYNADGDFEDLGEEVFSGADISSTANTMITIPADATLGLTRLRVIMSYDSITDACSGPLFLEFGEVEDYCVNIVMGVAPCDAPTGLDTTMVTENATVFSWAAVNLVSNYVLRYKQVTASAWTEMPVTTNMLTLDTLSYCKAYEAQVRSVCEEGQSDFSGSFYFTTYCNTSTKVLPATFSSLILSPNPFQDKINVQFAFDAVKEKVTIELLNKLGQVIEAKTRTKVKEGKIAFDGNQLPSGIYFISIKTGNGASFVQKVIKY